MNSPNTEIDSKHKEDFSGTEKIQNENGKLIVDKSDTGETISAKKNRRKQILKPHNLSNAKFVTNKDLDQQITVHKISISQVMKKIKCQKTKIHVAGM